LEVTVPTGRRFTFALPVDLAARLEAAVPSRQRNAFVEKAVRAQLRLLEREQLRAEMEECAKEMYDEILRIEAEFHPLENELHRQL
jgi:hypothetical protein